MKSYYDTALQTNTIECIAKVDEITKDRNDKVDAANKDAAYRINTLT
jgi:hypothetical protein